MRTNAGFAISLIDALPNTTAILGLSLSSASTAPCGLLIYLDPQFLMLPTPDGYGVTFSDPTGSASVAIPIPNDPVLDGLIVYGQWAVVDPQGGFASPVGNLALRVGRTLTLGQGPNRARCAAFDVDVDACGVSETVTLPRRSPTA